MSERSILFSSPNVRAILEGRKTMTRRVINFSQASAKDRQSRSCFGPDGYDTVTDAVMVRVPWTAASIEKYLKCPYGQPGDRLWVREAFLIQREVDGDPPPFDDGRPISRPDEESPSYWEQPHYRATDPPPELTCERENCKSRGMEACCHWQPSIFMPRWASRLMLEIAKIRIERLQEINEQDATAEGTPSAPGLTAGGQIGMGTARYWFKELWDSINAKGGFGWDVNPWVWAIEFKSEKAAR